MYFLERACATQIAALAGGVTLHYPTPEVQEVVRRQASVGIPQVAQLAWEPQLRLLDPIDPSYKS